MKKFMLGLLFIILLSTTLSANAETVVLKSNDYDKPLDSCYKYRDIVVKTNNGIQFWWTGTEFIKGSNLDSKLKKSDNLVEWSDMNLSYEVRRKIRHQYKTNIKHYGDKYIVYDEVYFNPSFIIDKMERTHGPIIKPIYTFDENFNLVNEFQLDKPLTDFEYVDGVYYAETQEYTKLGPQEYESKNTIYYSYDAIDWQIDNEMSNMPQSNGSNTLVFQGKLTNYITLSDYRFEVKDMFIEKNKSDLIKVVQERPITCYYKAKGDIYVETQYDNVDTFRISRDGVYSVDVAIPADSDDEHIIICDLWKDKLVLWTNERLIEYDMADIEDVLNEKCPSDTPYIEFDGNILGFDVPPIIEDSSTLVPMRFLFEQMGADVEWDSETQTATATLDNTVVTFSIDNINAEVNKTSATMAMADSSDFDNVFDLNQAKPTYDEATGMIKGKGEFGKVVESDVLEYYIDDTVAYDTKLTFKTDTIIPNNGNVTSSFITNASPLYYLCKDRVPISSSLGLAYDAYYSLDTGEEKYSGLFFDTYHSPKVNPYIIPEVVKVGPYAVAQKTTWETNEEFNNQWFNILANTNYDSYGDALSENLKKSAKDFENFLGETNMQGYGVTFKYNIVIHNLSDTERQFVYHAAINRRYRINCYSNGNLLPINSNAFDSDNHYEDDIYTIQMAPNETANIVIESTELAGASATCENWFRIQ